MFIVRDITHDVAEFNFIVMTTTTDENHTEKTKRFGDLVQIYSDAKGWASKISLIVQNVTLNGMHIHFFRCVMEFNQIIEYPLFSFFIHLLFSLASALVTIQFELVEYIFYRILSKHIAN